MRLVGNSPSGKEILMEIEVKCEHCGSKIQASIANNQNQIQIITKTTPPEEILNFNHVRELLYCASKIHITWGFDEQQADPIHRNFSFDQLKDELRKLLECQSCCKNSVK